MPNVIESNRSSDWLKREADSLFSREEITIASGAGVLVSGTVLGKITASGSYVRVTAAAVDGSAVASAILLYPVDATAAAAPAVAILRDAIVSNQGLSYGADVNTAALRTSVHAKLRETSPPTRTLPALRIRLP